MVKRFRRSAAGYDEQLPSDIRPPAVLKRTLDYLFNEIIGGPEPLAIVHKFVWDRTRGIRNDFSIQQVTKSEDLRIAIECFERIARFHILSLHQLSRTDLKDNEFDHHQEREQLNNTLLSLMYYYDDSRHKLMSPNEAEFRAYCIVFEVQDQRPDLEDRAQNWPRSILVDPRVQTAMKLYAAAGNTSDEQGPLRPRTSFLTAQANTGGFWSVISSNAVSYLTACVAEIYFNMVRTIALEAIWKAYKGKRGGSSKMEDWILTDLTKALGFDDEDQTAQFCEEHEFVIAENDMGDAYIDLGSVSGGQLRGTFLLCVSGMSANVRTDSNPRRKQIFSRALVEPKRLGRTLPAIINGVTASQAQTRGMIEESSDAEYASDGNESLFLNGESDIEQRRSQSRSRSNSPQKAETNNKPPSLNPVASPFQPTTVFGKPSGKPNPFQPMSTTSSLDTPMSIFSRQNSTEPAPVTFAMKEAPKFNPFQKPTATSSEDRLPTTNPSDDRGTPAFNPFQKPAESASRSTPANTNPFSSTETPAFSFFPTSGAEKVDATAVQAVGPPNSQPLPAAALLDRPSSPLTGNAPARQTPEENSSGTLFTWPQPVLSANGAIPSTMNFNSPTVKPNTNALFAPQAEAPKLSFGTSPLFQHFSDTPKNGGLATESKSLDTTISQTQQSPFAFSSPNLSSSETDLSIQKTAALPSSPSPPTPPTHSNTFFNPSSTHRHSLPSTSQSVTESIKSQSSPFPSAVSTSSNSLPNSTVNSKSPFQPSTKPSAARLQRDTSSSTSTISPKAFTAPPASQPLITPQRPDPKPKALDELAGGLMHEDGGLLQQFVEFTVAPIIRSSLIKYEDEKSWAIASQCSWPVNSYLTQQLILRRRVSCYLAS